MKKIFINISIIMGTLIISYVLMSCKTITKGQASNSKSDNSVINKNIPSIENSNNSSTVDKIYPSSGDYAIKISNFKGVFVIKEVDGQRVGYIKFNGWGTGKFQMVKDLRINGDDIYFVRSITTNDELKKYGGTRFFTHKYYGKFSKDRMVLKGYFRDGASQTNWVARKIK